MIWLYENKIESNYNFIETRLGAEITMRGWLVFYYKSAKIWVENYSFIVYVYFD